MLSGARLKKEKDELERVKEDLTKQYTLELQSYKMQKVVNIEPQIMLWTHNNCSLCLLLTLTSCVFVEKAREIDQVSERVRAAVDSKDASIALLKEELAKQQEQAEFLLDLS